MKKYFNEEDLDNHIHKRLLEHAPDIFTSLGILGTFVGLVWGLKNFEPSNYEAMTTSVSALVDGIKVRSSRPFTEFLFLLYTATV